MTRGGGDKARVSAGKGSQVHGHVGHLDSQDTLAGSRVRALTGSRVRALTGTPYLHNNNVETGQ